MACRTIATGPGMFAIACDRGARRQRCGTPGCGGDCVALCDYPVKRKGKDGTCDAKLCESCRVRQPQDRDFCPAHERFANSRPPAATSTREPERGDARIHVATGKMLYVRSITGSADERVVTFSLERPGDGRCAHLQTVPLEKWNAKTRAP